MYRGTLSAAELKAEPANLEVIQSKMITFHIMSTILNVGQGVLPTEKCFKAQEIITKIYCYMSEQPAADFFR